MEPSIITFTGHPIWAMQGHEPLPGYFWIHLSCLYWILMCFPCLVWLLLQKVFPDSLQEIKLQISYQKVFLEVTKKGYNPEVVKSLNTGKIFFFQVPICSWELLQQKCQFAYPYILFTNVSVHLSFSTSPHWTAVQSNGTVGPNIHISYDSNSELTHVTASI